MVRPATVEFYGQQGEDFLLWRLFEGKQSGFFVDIGAFDGIHLSNSYFFEKHGWKGLCVEAHPKYFPLCKKNRPQSICINGACVGASVKLASVIFLMDELGLLSGIDANKTPKLNERYAAQGMKLSGFKATEVPASTLNEIMDAHASDQSHIDFISIDTKGTELDILRDFDFKKYRVRCFVVEANGEQYARELIQFMQTKGFVLARALQENLFFCANQKDLILLRYARVNCRIADTLHPMGQAATLPEFRQRPIADNECWITPNVLCQQPDQPLHTLIDYFMPPGESSDGPQRLVHIINLFDRPGDEIHNSVQQRTIQTMLDAKEFLENDLVSHVSVHFSEDSSVVPESFSHSASLTRSVADVSVFRQERKLPLLFDLLDKGAESAEPDDYLIYTNNDICLKPYFYKIIFGLIEAGFDALTINRRTIGDLNSYELHPELAVMETGASHPGFDCLVFRCSNYKKFIRNNACIGAGWVMRGLLYNMVAHSKRMLMLKNVDLTYHFGDDQTWDDEDYSDYSQFNEQEYVKTLQQLSATGHENQLLRQFCQRHREKFVPP